MLELVWLDVDALASMSRDLCSESEWDRASRILSTPARQRSLAGAVALRLLAARHLGGGAERVQVRRHCPVCGEGADHGRPTLAGIDGIHVSVSHVGEWVLGAVTDLGPIGVDAEDPARTEFPEFTHLALHPLEIEALAEYTDPLGDVPPVSSTGGRTGARIWVRKEAFLKCLGVGLMVAPSEVRTGWPESACRVLGWPGTLADRLGAQGLPRLADIAAPPPLVAALATSTELPLEATLLDGTDWIARVLQNTVTQPRSADPVSG